MAACVEGGGCLVLETGTEGTGGGSSGSDRLDGAVAVLLTGGGSKDADDPEGDSSGPAEGGGSSPAAEVSGEKQ